MRVQLEMQRIAKECTYPRQEGFELVPVGRENDKIIGVSSVVFRLECVLGELVEFVHVRIDQHLGREVAERKPCTISSCVKTADDFCYKRDDFFIFEMLLHDGKQNLLVNGSEEFADIAFEYPAGARMVARNLARK